MTEFGAQIEFTGTLSLALVAGAGVISALTSRGREAFPGWRRPLLLVGLVCVGIAGVTRGAFIGARPEAFEAAGFIAIAAASWDIEPSIARRTLLATALCGIVAAVAHASGASATGGWLDLLTTALGVVSFIALSSGSLSAQIMAIAGGVATGAIVALATLMSVGIQGDLRSATVQQLHARLDFEAALVDRLPSDALATAGLTARGPLVAAQAQRLLAAAGRSQVDPVISAALASSRVGAATGLLFVTPNGSIAGLSGFDAGVPSDLGRTVAALGGTTSTGRSEFARVDDRIVAIGAVPVLVAGRSAGVIVAVDGVAEQVAPRSSDGVQLSVLTPQQAAAAPSTVASVTRRALAEDAAVTSTTGSRLVAARPLGRPPLGALVASTPREAVASSRRSLLRWLLVIAAAAALGVAGVCLGLGRRIGGRVTKLTLAAERLRAGDLAARAGLRGDDEVGRLGEAFDGMAASLEEAHAELRGTLTNESALRERLASVVGGIQEAVIAIDRDGRITEFNPSAESLLGVTSPGAPLGDVVHLRPTEVFDAVVAAAGPGETPLRRGHAVLGEDVPVEVSATPLGTPGGAVVLLRDLRPELDAERAKSEVLQRVSHELRTPLTPIKGWATLLGRRDLNATEAAEIGGELLASATRLERTFEQLLFMARSSGGEADMRLEAAAPAELVDQALQQWKATAAPDREVTVRCERRLPKVEADRRWCSQALRELLDNAAKFSPAGSEILVTAQRGPGVGEVGVSVTDRGSGLPQHLGRLASAFEQGDGSATRRYEGLGLGLAIVDRVARAHGGRLETTSGSSGTTVTLVFPVIGERGAGARRPGTEGAERGTVTPPA